MKHIQVDKDTKILLPATTYHIESDTRLLIPFTCGERIGFVNRNREVIVHPKYSMYYGEIYNETDCMKVAIKWGIINAHGEEILSVEYCNIWNFYGKNRYTVRLEKDGVSSDFTLRH